MPRKLMLFATAILLAGFSLPALAEETGPDWMSQEEITKKLTETAGYSHVTRLEAEDNRWEGKGMKDGKLMEFKADPRTGAVLKEELDK
jgi:hypothetical protein